MSKESAVFPFSTASPPSHVGARIFRWAAPLLVLLVFAAALWALYHDFRHIHWYELSGYIAGLPARRIVLAACATALSYACLACSDYFALRYVGQKLKLGTVALVSFISYAFSMNLGAAVVSGGTVRLRFYSALGLRTGEVARLVAFCAVAGLCGQALLSGLVFTLHPMALRDTVPFPARSPQLLGAGPADRARHDLGVGDPQASIRVPCLANRNSRLPNHGGSDARIRHGLGVCGHYADRAPPLHSGRVMDQPGGDHSSGLPHRSGEHRARWGSGCLNTSSLRCFLPRRPTPQCSAGWSRIASFTICFLSRRRSCCCWMARMAASRAWPARFLAPRPVLAALSSVAPITVALGVMVSGHRVDAFGQHASAPRAHVSWLREVVPLPCGGDLPLSGRVSIGLLLVVLARSLHRRVRMAWYLWLPASSSPASFFGSCRRGLEGSARAGSGSRVPRAGPPALHA